MPAMTRLRIYLNNHAPLILSIIILTCKIIVFAGMLTTIFSDDWARHPNAPGIHSDYRNRCSVHRCTSNNSDPIWLVDLACLLAIINLPAEIINIIAIYYFRYTISKMNIILEGISFLSTFIITDCGIIFGVYISSYAYKLPMGFAYKCFIFAIIFSMIDWGCSLKRLVIIRPERIYFYRNELLFHNHPMTIIVPIGHLSPIAEEDAVTSLKSIIIGAADA